MLMNVIVINKNFFEIIDGESGYKVGFILAVIKKEDVDSTEWIEYTANLPYQSDEFYVGWCFREALEWLQNHFDKELASDPANE